MKNLTVDQITAAFRYYGRHWDAQAKRARIAARLAQIRERTVCLFDFVCNGCGDHQDRAPVYSDWECGNCEYSGMARP